MSLELTVCAWWQGPLSWRLCPSSPRLFQAPDASKWPFSFPLADSQYNDYNTEYMVHLLTSTLTHIKRTIFDVLNVCSEWCGENVRICAFSDLFRFFSAFFSFSFLDLTF